MTSVYALGQAASGSAMLEPIKVVLGFVFRVLPVLQPERVPELAKLGSEGLSQIVVGISTKLIPPPTSTVSASGGSVLPQGEERPVSAVPSTVMVKRDHEWKSPLPAWVPSVPGQVTGITA
jgi:hypothetical protein